ncbi:hypothetical protein SCE1572_16640 [Sorangium cellulosum So0157-2]|uniref:Uncharacterized protein n=1 Tax=Sorangium cellulosum So0157-2 TaxID=1254432 RepID=S4XUI0_SORCE|nr:hypothetical protein SCE1572_16640 [Sorangium cellulosum So0157-2]
MFPLGLEPFIGLYDFVDVAPPRGCMARRGPLQVHRERGRR